MPLNWPVMALDLEPSPLQGAPSWSEIWGVLLGPKTRFMPQWKWALLAGLRHAGAPTARARTPPTSGICQHVYFFLIYLTQSEKWATTVANFELI